MPKTLVQYFWATAKTAAVVLFWIALSVGTIFGALYSERVGVPMWVACVAYFLLAFFWFVLGLAFLFKKGDEMVEAEVKRWRSSR